MAETAGKEFVNHLRQIVHSCGPSPWPVERLATEYLRAWNRLRSQLAYLGREAIIAIHVLCDYLPFDKLPPAIQLDVIDLLSEFNNLQLAESGFLDRFIQRYLKDCHYPIAFGFLQSSRVTAEYDNNIGANFENTIQELAQDLCSEFDPFLVQLAISPAISEDQGLILQPMEIVTDEHEESFMDVRTCVLPEEISINLRRPHRIVRQSDIKENEIIQEIIACLNNSSDGKLHVALANRLTRLNSDSISRICLAILAHQISDNQLVKLWENFLCGIAESSGRLPYQSRLTVIQTLITDYLHKLTCPLSRMATQSLLSVSQCDPDTIIEVVLVPIITGSSLSMLVLAPLLKWFNPFIPISQFKDRHQLEIVKRLTRDFNTKQLSRLITRLLNSAMFQDFWWSEPISQLYQHFFSLKNAHLSADAFQALLELFHTANETVLADPKFSSVIFQLIKRQQQQHGRCQKLLFHQIQRLADRLPTKLIFSLFPNNKL